MIKKIQYLNIVAIILIVSILSGCLAFVSGGTLPEPTPIIPEETECDPLELPILDEDPQVTELEDRIVYIYPEPDGRVVIVFEKGPVKEIVVCKNGAKSVLNGDGIRITDYPEPDKRTVIEYPEPNKRTLTIYPDRIELDFDDLSDGLGMTIYNDGSIAINIEGGGSVTTDTDGDQKYNPIYCDEVIKTERATDGALIQTYLSGIKTYTYSNGPNKVIVPDSLNEIPDCEERDDGPVMF